MNSNITRRTFLKQSAAVAATLSLPAFVWSNAQGANNDIRVAVVGFRGRGGEHISQFRKLPGVRVVALCDADSNVLDKAAKDFEKRNEKVETYTDVRKLLENKDVDVISSATPNHWHSLITVWACQAGKDVYMEKPVSHNVWEGRQSVKAAAKYKRIVQTGTQCRSSIGIIEGIAFLRKGGLGKILVSRGLCYKRRASIGKTTGETSIPAGIDYDLWCGPAPKEPLRRRQLHYDWHWVWPTGNGDLGNQGIHQMDICRWALGVQELSPRVIGIGGRFGYDDDGETPNTMIAYHDYPVAPLIFEVRGLPQNSDAKDMDKYRGASIGCVIDCENGYMVIPSYSEAIAYDKSGKEIKRFKAGKGKSDKPVFDKDGKPIMEFKEDEGHFGNFIRAVRSRKPSDLNSSILEGHLSSALCHTANVSYLIGEQSAPGEILEQIKGSKEATETFGRFKEHLAVNGVKIDETKATLGPWLKMNPKTERFENNDKANALLTRDYRKPFVVPEQV